MTDADFPSPSFKLDVDFVCNTAFLPSNSNSFTKASFTNRKTKFVSTHPTLPLILSLDECANVSLWDTQLQQIVWQCSGFSLQKEAILQQYHAQNIPKETNKQFSLKSKHASLARINGPAMRNLGNIHIPNFAPLSTENTVAGASTANVPPEVLKDSLGDLKAVDFADIDYIMSQGGKELSDFPHLNTSLLQQTAKHRLVFLFDQAIVVYNYTTGKVLSILRMNQEYLSATTVSNNATNNNNVGKVKPTCWEWLTTGHLAIGCSDGYVRVFEDMSLTSSWRTNIVNKTLCKKREKNLLRTMSLISVFSVHQFSSTASVQYQPSSASFPAPAVSSGEVSILRLIPSVLERNGCDEPTDASSLWEKWATELRHTVQLLTVSSDGSVFAWRLTYFSHLNLNFNNTNGNFNNTNNNFNNAHLSVVESGFLGTDCPVSRLSEGIIGGLSLASSTANSGTAQTSNSTNFNFNSNNNFNNFNNNNNSVDATHVSHQTSLSLSDVSQLLVSQPVSHQSLIATHIPARFDRQQRLFVDCAFVADNQPRHTCPWSQLIETHFPVCRVSLRSLTLQLLVSEGVVRLFDLTAAFFLPLLLRPSVTSNDALRRDSFKRDKVETAAKVETDQLAKKKPSSLFGSVFKSTNKPTNSQRPSVDSPSVIKTTSTSTAASTSTSSSTIYLISAYASVKPGKAFSDNLRKNAFLTTGLSPLPLSLASNASSSPISGMYLLPAKHDELSVVYSAQMSQALFHHQRQHLLWLQSFVKPLFSQNETPSSSSSTSTLSLCCELKNSFENVLSSLETQVNAGVSQCVSFNSVSNVYNVCTNLELFETLGDTQAASSRHSWGVSQEEEQMSVASSSLQGVHHTAKRSSLKRFSSNNLNSVSTHNLNNNYNNNYNNTNNNNNINNNGNFSGNLYGINVKQVSAWRLELVHLWPSVTELVVAYLEKLFMQQATALRETAPSVFVANRLAQLKEAWSYDKSDKLKLYGVSLHSATGHIVCSTNIGAVVLRFTYCYPQIPQTVVTQTVPKDRFFPSSSSSSSSLLKGTNDSLIEGGDVVASLSVATFHPINDDKCNGDKVNGDKVNGDKLHDDDTVVVYKQEVAYVAELHVLRRRVRRFQFNRHRDTARHCEVVCEENMKLPPIPVSLSLSNTTNNNVKTQTRDTNVFAVSQGGGGVRPIMKRSPCGTAVSLLFPTHHFYLLCKLPRITTLKRRSSETVEALKETVSEDATENVHLGALKLLSFGRASHLAWTQCDTPQQDRDTASVCLLRIPRHSVAETDATVAAATQIALQLQQRDKEKKNKRLSMFSSLMSGSAQSNLHQSNLNTQYLNVRKEIPAYLAAKVLTFNAQHKLCVRDVSRVSLHTGVSQNDTTSLIEEVQQLFSGPITTVSYSVRHNNVATRVTQMFSLTLGHTATHQTSTTTIAEDPESQTEPDSQTLLTAQLTAVSPLLPNLVDLKWVSVSVTDNNFNNNFNSNFNHVADNASLCHSCVAVGIVANSENETAAVYRLTQTEEKKWRLEAE